MPDVAQNYSNHLRFRPLFHFTSLPIFLINAIVGIVLFVKNPTGMMAWTVLVQTFLFLYALDNRSAIIAVQDRVIRDEMHLRLARVLGVSATDKLAKLSVDHLIGLRFASDAELPALVDRVIAGELPNRKAIKQAVTAWQPDHLRA